MVCGTAGPTKTAGMPRCGLITKATLARTEEEHAYGNTHNQPTSISPSVGGAATGMTALGSLPLTTFPRALDRWLLVSVLSDPGIFPIACTHAVVSFPYRTVVLRNTAPLSTAV
jgi:hypothetical protein